VRRRDAPCAAAAAASLSRLSPPAPSYPMMMRSSPPQLQGTPHTHSSRHGPQRTPHTASTAVTPRYPQARSQTPAEPQMGSTRGQPELGWDGAGGEGGLPQPLKSHPDTGGPPRTPSRMRPDTGGRRRFHSDTGGGRRRSTPASPATSAPTEDDSSLRTEPAYRGTPCRHPAHTLAFAR